MAAMDGKLMDGWGTMDGDNGWMGTMDKGPMDGWETMDRGPMNGRGTMDGDNGWGIDG